MRGGWRVAEQGLVLLLMSSAPAGSSVAPSGGTRALFSPSPIGVGIPTGAEPVMVDVSTSITTNGLTGRLARECAKLPGAWLIDQAGVATDDPAVLVPPRTGRSGRRSPPWAIAPTRSGRTSRAMPPAAQPARNGRRPRDGRRNLMSIIGTILVGFVVGLLARALKPGDDKMGLIMTTILGIAGAVLARYAGIAMGLYQEGRAAGWIASIVGAVVLLFIYGMTKGDSRRS